MTVALLELPSGAVSLEFDSGDTAQVMAALAALLGAARVREQSALYDLVDIGSERFLHYHEWDPCLISTSAAGALVLRSVAGALAGPGRRA